MIKEWRSFYKGEEQETLRKILLEPIQGWFGLKKGLPPASWVGLKDGSSRGGEI